MADGEPARLSTDETGLRLSVELQITYATGVVAGTVMAAYQILAYGRDTGFDSVWKLSMASFLATLLELVTVGMVLHVMYRGFWIAMRLLVETRVDQGRASPELVTQWEREIRELDGTCQAFFFQTFRVLYAGMFWGLLVLACVLCGRDDVLGTGLGYLLLAIVLPASVLAPLARRWPFAWLRPALQKASVAVVDLRRNVGLWWLSDDPEPIGRNRWILLSSIALVFFVSNFIPMTQAALTADKAVYFPSSGDRVVLTYHHGGIVPGPEIHPHLSADFSSLRTAAAADVFQRVGANTYVAVVDARAFHPGPARVRVNYRLSVHHGEKSHMSISPSDATAEFLIAR